MIFRGLTVAPKYPSVTLGSFVRELGCASVIKACVIKIFSDSRPSIVIDVDDNAACKTKFLISSAGKIHNCITSSMVWITMLGNSRDYAITGRNLESLFPENLVSRTFRHQIFLNFSSWEFSGWTSFSKQMHLLSARVILDCVGDL